MAELPAEPAVTGAAGHHGPWYEIAFDASPLPSAVADDAGRLVYANDALRGLLGPDAGSLELLKERTRVSHRVVVSRAATGERIVQLLSHPERVRDADRRELEATRRMLEGAFTHAPIGKVISRVRADGTSVIVKANHAIARMLGVSVEELVGRPGQLMVHADDVAVRTRLVDEVLAGRPASGELRLRRGDGSHLWVLMALTPLREDDGSTAMICQALDISDRKRLEDELRHLVDHDALTGLRTRRRFQHDLLVEIARAERTGRDGCVLFVDLDGFKAINDRFGHAAGDDTLRGVAAALRQRLRATDIIARLGGDEFAAVLPDTDLEGGRAVADAVRRAVADTAPAGVTASIGVARLIAGQDITPSALMMRADAAMYTAKTSGRDTVAVSG